MLSVKTWQVSFIVACRGSDMYHLTFPHLEWICLVALISVLHVLSQAAAGKSLVTIYWKAAIILMPSSFPLHCKWKHAGKPVHKQKTVTREEWSMIGKVLITSVLRDCYKPFSGKIPAKHKNSAFKFFLLEAVLEVCSSDSSLGPRLKHKKFWMPQGIKDHSMMCLKDM